MIDYNYDPERIGIDVSVYYTKTMYFIYNNNV